MGSNFDEAQRFFQDAPGLYYPVPVPTDIVSKEPAPGLVPESSPWWIDRLTSALDARNGRMVRLKAYYEGTQDTWRISNEAFRLTFGRAFWGLKANLAMLVVASAEHRLKVTGFRIPLETGDGHPASAPAGEPPAPPEGSPATPDPESLDETDKEAWRVWQANNLDSLSAVAHTMALSMGECPVLVSPGKDKKTPRITVEDPLQVYVERDPADPTARLAAIKRYTDIGNKKVHILYLPDRIEWWECTGTYADEGAFAWTQSDQQFRLRGQEYTLIEAKSGKPAVPGEVPVVLLVNQPKIDGTGRAEHEAVIPLFDLYNKTLMDMAVSSEFLAFPQRYAIGVSLDEEADGTDSSGNVTTPAQSPLKAMADRLWSTENPDAKFGSFAAADLKPYTDALAMIRSDIGTITFTPYHYLLNMPSSVPPTGEALKTAETALVKKCERKTIDLGEGWEEVMRLAFLTMGDVERASTRSETRWAPIESRQLVSLADTLTKLATIGVPEPQLWQDYGYTPEQIARFDAMRKAAPVPAMPARITVPEVAAQIDEGGTGAPTPPPPTNGAASPPTPATVPGRPPLPGT